MNNDNLKDGQAKFLTYLVYVLLTVLSIITTYNMYVLTSLPREYVRLERYLCDQSKIENKLDRMDQKLDQILLSAKKP